MFLIGTSEENESPSLNGRKDTNQANIIGASGVSSRGAGYFSRNIKRLGLIRPTWVKILDGDDYFPGIINSLLIECRIGHKRLGVTKAEGFGSCKH